MFLWQDYEDDGSLGKKKKHVVVQVKAGLTETSDFWTHF